MNGISMREGFGRALAAYGEVNASVVVLDVDTASSTLSSLFADRYPERFFNIGIAEPCMIDMAVGLSLGGMIPFANGFAALLALRAVEQIRTCVCYAHANVKICAGYGGLSDFKDGPTHHAITDLAIMRALPEMTVIVAADATEAAAWVPVIAAHEGPLYLRLNRGPAIVVHDGTVPLEIGKGIVRRNGSDVTIVATGAMVGRSMRAADQLVQDGIDARVIEMHTLKPLDTGLILEAAEETGALVAAEEHSVIGGLGGAVSEALSQGFPAPLEIVGIADTFACTGPDPESLMDAYGLAVEDIVAAARKAMSRRDR